MQKISVTLAEAIEISGIGRTSFYEIFKSGALKPRKVGTRLIIVVAELEEFISSLPSN